MGSQRPTTILGTGPGINSVSSEYHPSRIETAAFPFFAEMRHETHPLLVKIQSA